MDDESKQILKKVGFEFNELCDLNELIIPRDQFLSDAKYDEIKVLLPQLKKFYRSSLMTSLQKNAEKIQKWPLLNFVRQILNTYDYKMIPIRKADGYMLDGTKKYKRYFQIKKKHENVGNKNEKTKVIIFNDTEINAEIN
jgi:hypothetical protein